MIEKKQEIISKIKEYRARSFDSLISNTICESDILNHIHLENGAQPPKEQHIYEFKDGYVRFVQNRDYDSDSHMTYIPISKKNHLCTKTDIMIDKYGDAGAVRYGIEGAFNVALLKIIPNKEYETEFIRDFLSQEKIKNILYLSSQASTRPSLNESTFTALKMPILDEDMLKSYQNKMTKLLEISIEIQNELTKLKQIKANLLSKYF